MRKKFKETIKGILIILAAILFAVSIIALVLSLDALRVGWFKFLWKR